MIIKGILCRSTKKISFFGLTKDTHFLETSNINKTYYNSNALSYHYSRTITNLVSFSQLIEIIFESSIFSVSLIHNYNFSSIKILNFINFTFFNVDQNKLTNFSNNTNKNLIMSDSNLWTTSFLFFSCLEDFDKTTTTVILNNNVIKSYDFKSGDLQSYEEYDKLALKNLDEYYREILLSDYRDLYRPAIYEHKDEVPYYNNYKFENHVYISYWSHFHDISHRWATSDLIWSFYYQLPFFFWDKIHQPLDEFRLISFFRQRVLLLDDRIFNTKVKDEKVIFLPLKNLSHYSELKSGLKIFKRLHNYESTHFLNFYLKFNDVQDYAFDKNFLHVWNYWIGASHEANNFSINGDTGFLNYLKEKLYTPRSHINSKHYWNDLNFLGHNTRVMNFVFFPDLTLMMGPFNPAFDDFAFGYNWFFHTGNTFMDATILIKLIRYQLTYNIWGVFEYLVEDYSFYQPTYFSDNLASVRIPMILLVSKQYNNSEEMEMFIDDYDSIFKFRNFKVYKDLTGEVLFPLTPLQRLERLHDVQPVDRNIHSHEWLITLFFGYNYSNTPINYPSWFNFVTPDGNTSFHGLKYDTSEDKLWWDNTWKIINKFSSSGYKYRNDLSIYFNVNNMPLELKTIFRYLNEKLYNDPGYNYTTWNRSQSFQSFNRFNWLNKISIIYFEYLPQQHYNWNITVFGQNIWDWSIFNNTKIPKFTYNFTSAIWEGFNIGIRVVHFESNLRLIGSKLYLPTWPSVPNAFFIEFKPIRLYCFFRDLSTTLGLNFLSKCMDYTLNTLGNLIFKLPIFLYSNTISIFYTIVDGTAYIINTTRSAIVDKFLSLFTLPVTFIEYYFKLKNEPNPDSFIWYFLIIYDVFLILFFSNSIFGSFNPFFSGLPHIFCGYIRIFFDVTQPLFTRSIRYKPPLCLLKPDWTYNFIFQFWKKDPSDPQKLYFNFEYFDIFCQINPDLIIKLKECFVVDDNVYPLYFLVKFNVNLKSFYHYISISNNDLWTHINIPLINEKSTSYNIYLAEIKEHQYKSASIIDFFYTVSSNIKYIFTKYGLNQFTSAVNILNYCTYILNYLIDFIPNTLRIINFIEEFKIFFSYALEECSYKLHLFFFFKQPFSLSFRPFERIIELVFTTRLLNIFTFFKCILLDFFKGIENITGYDFTKLNLFYFLHEIIIQIKNWINDNINQTLLKDLILIDKINFLEVYLQIYSPIITTMGEYEIIHKPEELTLEDLKLFQDELGTDVYIDQRPAPYLPVIFTFGWRPEKLNYAAYGLAKPNVKADFDSNFISDTNLYFRNIIDLELTKKVKKNNWFFFLNYYLFEKITNFFFFDAYSIFSKLLQTLNISITVGNKDYKIFNINFIPHHLLPLPEHEKLNLFTFVNKIDISLMQELIKFLDIITISYSSSSAKNLYDYIDNLKDEEIFVFFKTNDLGNLSNLNIKEFRVIIYRLQFSNLNFERIKNLFNSAVIDLLLLWQIDNFRLDVYEYCYNDTLKSLNTKYFEFKAEEDILKNKIAKSKVAADSYFNVFIKIYNYFFEYTHLTTTIKTYNFIDTNYKYTTLCLVQYEPKTLPLFFFAPFCVFSQSDYCRVSEIDLAYSNFKLNLTPEEYFSNLSNPSNLKNFVEIWMVYELNKNYGYENNLSEITRHIYNIDTRPIKLRSLEYQRYNNYVLKHKCYKDKKLNTNN